MTRQEREGGELGEGERIVRGVKGSIRGLGERERVGGGGGAVNPRIG